MADSPPNGKLFEASTISREQSIGTFFFLMLVLTASTALALLEASTNTLKINALNTNFDDRAKIGTLDVPRLGVGTIAWTADTPEDKARIAKVASAAT